MMSRNYFIRKILTGLFLTIIIIAGLTNCTEQKIRILIIDGFSNHDWSYTTEVITSMLKNSGFSEVDISTMPPMDDPGYKTWQPDFGKYDVVVQNTNSLGNKMSWPEPVKKDFEEYMQNGGGMYVFHSGNNAFPEWEEYDKMLGLGWRKSDQGEAIEIVDGEIVRIPAGEGPGTDHGPRRTLVVKKLQDHPINHGYPEKWITPDIELYTYARGKAENLQVLSYTYDSITEKNWPVDWVVDYGEGRIYNSTYGHLWHNQRMPESIQCLGFQTTFHRAIQWLATSRVSSEVPENFPSETAVSIVPIDMVYREKDGWLNMYSGNTLDGWYVECLDADRDKTYWTAEDGYIECNSIGRPDHGYYWLMNEGEYDDFQLRLEFQVFKKSTGNSGVQIRSRFSKNDVQTEGGWLNGPQVDIHPLTPFRTGLIYDESRGYQRWIYPSRPSHGIDPEHANSIAQQTTLIFAEDDPDAWNSLEIICQGMQIRTFVNGRRITRFDATGILDDSIHGENGVGTTGQIALQLHAKDELLIRFRNIYIREITKQISNK